MTDSEFWLNRALIWRADELRAALNINNMSEVDGQRARRELEDAIADAMAGDCEWQRFTGSELCSALGHNTLFGWLSQEA